MLDLDRNKIDLTDGGLEHVRRASAASALWAGTIRREETIRKALAALYLFRPDIHYLVKDGKVQIVDEYTGRLMPDRSWERGIHQLIEIKEGASLPARWNRSPASRISVSSGGTCIFAA